jgi:hypothetical protein
MRESETAAPSSGRRTSRGRTSPGWRWIAVAAAVVVVLVGTLVLLTAQGGHDDERAIGDKKVALTPEAAAAVPDVGDFGDLDRAANLDSLRAALAQRASGSAAAPRADAGETFGATAARPPAAGASPLAECAATAPSGHIVAQGSGTIDGRRATVVLVESADGTRSVDAVLQGPCELRHLS